MELIIRDRQALAALIVTLFLFTHARAQNLPVEPQPGSESVSNLAIGPGDMLDLRCTTFRNSLSKCA